MEGRRGWGELYRRMDGWMEARPDKIDIYTGH
jgi:hypothetical protein